MLKREVIMKSGDKKKKLALQKTTIAHLDRGKIIEIKDTLKRIRGGVTIEVTEAGLSCPCGGEPGSP